MGKSGSFAHAAPQMFSSSDVNRSLYSLDRLISRSVALERPIWSSSEDSTAFLDAVDSLLSLTRSMDSINPEDRRAVDHADDLLQQSMFRLREEFRTLMESQSSARPSDPISTLDLDGEETDDEDLIPTAQPITDYNIVIDALPAGTIADLREIAKRMIAGGFHKEVAEVYSLSRRDFLDESISRLGFHLKNNEEIQTTPWPELAEEIGRWIKVINVAIKILFHSERRLCDRVFDGFPSDADASLADICRVPAMQLLGFANAVSVNAKEPERLFKILDLYEALRDLIAESDLMVADQYSSFLRFESVTTCNRLGGTVRGIFTDLENRTRKDPARSAYSGCGPHPITRYVINYLCAACKHQQALEEIMYEDEGGFPPPDREILSSSLSVRISWIMDVLQSNLEEKSRIHSSPGQNFFFLLNNGWYMIQKVKNSEVGILLGEDWIRRQVGRVRQWKNGYQRAAWGRIIEVLRIGSNAGLASSVAARSLKDKLHMFNGDFEEIYGSQKGWIAADDDLRTDLRRSIVQIVLPVYRGFMEKLMASESGKEMESLVKFSPGKVESCINELFQLKSK